jgi:nicotinamidase-related amidase
VVNADRGRPVAAQRRIPGRSHPLGDVESLEWAFDPARTVLILCDLWDQHWCPGAAARVDVIAPRVEAVVESLRAAGVGVAHAPSECMAFYTDHPARRRALALPAWTPPPERDLPVPGLPIDDSDGGCDTPHCGITYPWTRQHAAIGIDDDDLISDDGATICAWLAARRADRILLAGVHANRCILNRSFGLKQLARWSIPRLLIRDLTDAMYNPARYPFVSHDDGTALVVAHIERHWAPTATSEAVVGGLNTAGHHSQ